MFTGPSFHFKTGGKATKSSCTLNVMNVLNMLNRVLKGGFDGGNTCMGRRLGWVFISHVTLPALRLIHFL